MQSTILTLGRLREWMDQNKARNVLPLTAELVGVTTYFPALFTNALPIERLVVASKEHAFVQVIAAHKLVGDIFVRRILDSDALKKIPLVLVLFDYTEPADGQEVTTLSDAMAKSLDVRQKLIDKWTGLNQRYPNRSLEFLATVEALAGTIVGQLATGAIAELGGQIQSNLRKQVEFLESSDKRKEAIKTAVGESPGAGGEAPKRFRPVHSFDLTGGGGRGTDGADIIAPLPAAPDQSPAGEPVRLEEELSALTDALSQFIFSALGTYGGAVARAYHGLPVVSSHYTSQRRVDAYLARTKPFVMAAIRRLQAELSPHTERLCGRPWRLVALLQHPNSTLFTHCAALAGNFMRKAELQSVTRSNLPYHAVTELQRETNDAKERVLEALRTHFAECCYFVEGV